MGIFTFRIFYYIFPYIYVVRRAFTQSVFTAELPMVSSGALLLISVWPGKEAAEGLCLFIDNTGVLEVVWFKDLKDYPEHKTRERICYVWKNPTAFCR
jgi:hypothetical protein